MALTFDQFTARLNAMSNEFRQEVEGIVEHYTGEIEVEAKANAPTGGSRIATRSGSISVNQINEKRLGTAVGNIAGAITYSVDNTGLKGTVVIDKSAGDLAAYVEFGTGQDASSYLATVPTEWRAAAAKFYVNGKGQILHKPFLLPAFMKNKIPFKKDLKKALKDLKI